MKTRHLSPTFFADFLFDETKNQCGQFQDIIEIVKSDPYLDLELRGDRVTLYYRGGRIMEINEDGLINGMDAKYLPEDVQEPYLERVHVFEYICKAKVFIDKYELKRNHLGEKEIQQRIIFENNRSVNAEDTDYFIADVEWADNEELGGRADIVAFQWNHMEHRKRILKMVLIEVKQGENSLRTRTSTSKKTNKSEFTAGLYKHIEDYNKFSKNLDYVKAVEEDMNMVLFQKYKMGLVQGLENLYVNNKLPEVEEFPEFLILLANYKPYSKELRNEIAEFTINAKFVTSCCMGYGLYHDFIFSTEQLKQQMAILFSND